MDVTSEKPFRGAKWISSGKLKGDGVNGTLFTANFSTAFKETKSLGCLWKAVYHLGCSEQEYAFARRHIDMKDIEGQEERLKSTKARPLTSSHPVEHEEVRVDEPAIAKGAPGLTMISVGRRKFLKIT